MTQHMFYSKENIEILQKEWNVFNINFKKMIDELTKLDQRITNQEAREYLQHGVMRRLFLIWRCISKIFIIYPPDRKTALTDEERFDINISLHSLFMNIFGILDNLAWVLNYEKNYGLEKRDIGLFTNAFKSKLTAGFKIYLYSDRMRNWHFVHLKEYRDSLAHRIPLYVPPHGVNPHGVTIEPFPVFSGSLLTTADAAVLHPQIMADFNSVREIIEKFLEFEFPITGS